MDVRGVAAQEQAPIRSRDTIRLLMRNQELQVMSWNRAGTGERSS